MCHPILLGVVGGIIAAKLFYRLRRGGGGCARRCDSGGYRRFGRWSRRGYGAPTAPASGIKLADLAGRLELNARQKEEAGEVFARLTSAFGERVQPGERLAAVLETISAEPPPPTRSVCPTGRSPARTRICSTGWSTCTTFSPPNNATSSARCSREVIRARPRRATELH
jgi:hypothetical protein